MVKIVRKDMSFIMPHRSCMKIELNVLGFATYNIRESISELGTKIIVKISTPSFIEFIN
jgi:hypothetical protein